MRTKRNSAKGSFKLFDSIRQQLGMNHAQYSKALGMSANATAKYTRDKQVPKVVELAAQSLLREPLQAPKVQDPNPETYLLQITGNVPKVTRVLGVEVVNFLGKEYTLLELPAERKQPEKSFGEALAESGFKPVPGELKLSIPTRRPLPKARKPQVKKRKVGSGGARPGSGRRPVVEGANKHQRVVNQVVSLLKEKGPSRIADIFEAIEANGSDEFGIRNNASRTVRLARFSAILSNEQRRTQPKITKPSYGFVALANT